MRTFVAVRRVLWDAFGHFDSDDGWSMSSHLAISALMALFPFLIFATALASFLGAKAFADTAVHLVFDTWPDQIAEPISNEVVRVLTVQRGDFLTLSVLLAGFFASNGIEALRVSLNRAYRVPETRPSRSYRETTRCTRCSRASPPKYSVLGPGTFSATSCGFFPTPT